MREVLARLESRLHAVDRSLITGAEIAAARQDGANCAPSALLTDGLGRARQNPVLGAAFAAGAVDASQTAAQAASANIALSIALLRWGYFRDAFTLVSGVTMSPPFDLYARWVSILSERRLHGVDYLPYDELILIADKLEAHGIPLDAARCRQDAAVTEWSSAEAAAILDDVHEYLHAAGYAHETALGHLLKAYVARRRGGFDESIADLDRAEALAETHMPDLRAYVWLMRGNVYTDMRQFSRASAWLDRAADLSQRLNHAFYAGSALADKAHLLFMQGRIEESGIALDAVEQMDAALDAAHLRADVLNTRGTIMTWQGDDDDVQQHFEDARAIFEDLNVPLFAAMCTGNIGLMELRRGNFSRAMEMIEAWREACEMYHHYEFQAIAYMHVSQVYTAFGYVEPAIEHARKALSMLAGENMALHRIRHQLHLARLLVHKDPSEAEQILSEIYEQAVAGDMHWDAAVALQLHGEVLAQQGRHKDALARFQSSYEQLAALNLTQAVWRSRLGAAESFTALRRTEWAANALFELPEERLPTALRWRYYAVVARLAALNNRRIDARQNYVKAIQVARNARRSLNAEDEMARFVYSLNPLYSEALNLALEDDDAQVALTLAELHGAQLMSVRWGQDFLAEYHPDHLISLARSALNQHAGQGWTVLRYTWHGEKPGVFVITPDHLEYVPIRLEGLKLPLKICTQPTESDRRFAYLGELPGHANAPAESARMRRDLYEALIPPTVRSRLHPDELLVIIPSGRELHGLSFQALLGESGPLVGQAAILYAQSLDILRISLEPGASGSLQGQGLIFAQSEFSHEGYSPLRHADREAENITRSVSAEAHLLHGNGSSRATLLALAQSGDLQAYDWLHFTTHAFANEETGAFTGLITGREVLSLEHIRDWRLHARLVTLSACQTGMGEYHHGDEIAGLAQAFQSARADTVVATLWLVPDDPHVADFMGDFYRLLAADVSPAHALAGAQRTAYRAGLAPYYWAAYSAFGSP